MAISRQLTYLRLELQVYNYVTANWKNNLMYKCLPIANVQSEIVEMFQCKNYLFFHFRLDITLLSTISSCRYPSIVQCSTHCEEYIFVPIAERLVHLILRLKQNNIQQIQLKLTGNSQMYIARANSIMVQFI